MAYDDIDFDKLANKIAYELGEKIIEEIGSGDFGSAFSLESGKVLKITSDSNEVIIAKKLTKNKNLFKHIMNYYNVGQINDELYFILMDQITPLSFYERKIVNYTYKSILQFSKSFYTSVMGENFVENTKALFNKKRFLNRNFLDRYDNKEIEEMKQFALSLIPDIKKIAKELKLHGIEQCDFHGGNLGWDKNHNLVIFDLSRPYRPYFDPKPKNIKQYSIMERNLSTNSTIDTRILQIAEDLGEEIVDYLGNGAFGYSFKTKSNKVLKITSDETEAHIAYKLSKKKSWLRCLINYYNVGKIKPLNPSRYTEGYNWYILMDLVNPLTIEEQKAFDCYMKPMQYETTYYENMLDKADIMDHIDYMYNPDSWEWKSAKSGGQDPEKIKQIAIDFYPKVLKIAKELKRKGIIQTDFHSGNVGWDSSHENLVLYDLGGSGEEYVKGFKDEIVTTEKLITKFKNFNKPL